MKKIYIIKELQDNTYAVYPAFDNFSPVYYDYMYYAIELCRIRLGRKLQDNDIKIIKIPFTKTWIVL